VVCPYCNANDDKVIDSRASEGGKVIRRRRQCLKCKKRFTTYERVEELTRLTVIKRDGSRVPFSRDNILRGIQAACGKRPIPEPDRQRAVDEIEEEVYRIYEREVPSHEIGQLVCDKLRDLDEVAYIRFASEHRRFSDLGEVEKEVRELKSRVKDAKEQARLF
jgi:transcriptional repressor NrdR